MGISESIDGIMAFFNKLPETIINGIVTVIEYIAERIPWWFKYVAIAFGILILIGIIIFIWNHRNSWIYRI